VEKKRNPKKSWCSKAFFLPSHRSRAIIGNRRKLLRRAIGGDKMSKARGKPPSDPAVEAISKALIEERRDDTVMIFIPSHDRNRPQRKLNNQDQWADAGLKLFSALYGGATAFMALRGVWKHEDGTDLFDEPIIIQSLAKREDVESEEKLEMLVEFAKRLCKETNQECVAVICNDTIHFLRE
jgi:hypothetical protein